MRVRLVKNYHGARHGDIAVTPALFSSEIGVIICEFRLLDKTTFKTFKREA